MILNIFLNLRKILRQMHPFYLFYQFKNKKICAENSYDRRKTNEKRSKSVKSYDPRP